MVVACWRDISGDIKSPHSEIRQCFFPHNSTLNREEVVEWLLTGDDLPRTSFYPLAFAKYKVNFGDRYFDHGVYRLKEEEMSAELVTEHGLSNY